METNERITVEEASAALASAERSRVRVAWIGYPAWYWLTTGACLGGLAYAFQLHGWWVLAITAVIAAVIVIVARAASRVRGVCEGYVRTSMTVRESAVLGGPAALLMIVGAFAAKFASWASIPAAVLVFAVFAGTGLTLGARAARR
jgi:hypothetical protein